MPEIETRKNAALDVLAAEVVAARINFEAKLNARRRRFPHEAFDRLWDAVLAYATVMEGLGWVHRDVAREVNGLREYLQLECHRTPSDVVQRADRLECILFCGHDPCIEGQEPSDSEGE